MPNESDTATFIVFAIADYRLALPIETVLRVVRYPVGSDRELGKMGLVQLGRHLIKQIDLHQFTAAAAPPEPESFLVITPTPDGELCGLLVYEPPILMKLPVNIIQPLPPSSRQSGLLSLVSHAAIASPESSTPIFLLDIRQALNPRDRSLMLSGQSDC